MLNELDLLELKEINGGCQAYDQGKSVGEAIRKIGMIIGLICLL